MKARSLFASTSWCAASPTKRWTPVWRDYYMPSEGDDYLTVRSIKRQIDGALGVARRVAAGTVRGHARFDWTRARNRRGHHRHGARIAIKHGYQVNTHAIGDRANREVLDIYEAVFDSVGGADDLRWRIEHAQHVPHPDDVARFAELGVTRLNARRPRHLRRALDPGSAWETIAPRSEAILWRSFLERGRPSSPTELMFPSRTSTRWPASARRSRVRRRTDPSSTRSRR